MLDTVQMLRLSRFLWSYLGTVLACLTSSIGLKCCRNSWSQLGIPWNLGLQDFCGLCQLDKLILFMHVLLVFDVILLVQLSMLDYVYMLRKYSTCFVFKVSFCTE